MPKLLAIIAQVVACLFLLTGCSNVISDTEGLLKAPTLNKQQAEVNAALEATTNTDIIPRYPQRGDHLSPFTFYDMDGDGKDEVIILYSLAGDTTSTRVKILREEGDGQWVAVKDIPSVYDQVDFIQFANLLSPDSSCLVIGWKSSVTPVGRGIDGNLAVYSYMDGDFRTEISQHRYYECNIGDFNEDGLAEIATIQHSQNEALQLSLLRGTGRRITAYDPLPLSRNAYDVLQITSGKLWDRTFAIFIDELGMNEGVTDNPILKESTGTEIIRLRENRLEVLASGNNPSTPERENPVWENYSDTFRDAPLLSWDYNGDGLIEIPHQISLPGDLYVDDPNPLLLTQLLQLSADGMVIVDSTVINEKEGYIFLFPEQWLDWVSVLRDEENDTWHFYLIDTLDDPGDPKIELLRILAVDTTGDPNPSERYIELGQRGTRHYLAYMPYVASALTLTEAELLQCFRLLPQDIIPAQRAEDLPWNLDGQS